MLQEQGTILKNKYGKLKLSDADGNVYFTREWNRVVLDVAGKFGDVEDVDFAAIGCTVGR